MDLKRFVKKVKRRLSGIFRNEPDFLEQNKVKHIKQCYICGEKFETFYRYRINNDNDRIIKYFQLVGSDTENFGCYYCNCNDRERHLFMYFDKLSLWDKFKSANILHFAPEPHISSRIGKISFQEYVKCDLYPREDWIKIDITKIEFGDNYFDILICNHVLEHVIDHLQAMKEISRVLKKDGFAILQTPYSELLQNHFEDPGINNDDLRLLFYGQEDHVRIVSKRQFIDDLSMHFTVNVVKNNSLFSDEECYKYGVNRKEDLVMVFNNKLKND